MTKCQRENQISDVILGFLNQNYTSTQTDQSVYFFIFV